MSTEPFEIHTPGNPPASMPEGGWPEVPKPFTNEHGQWKLEGALEAFKQSRDECATLRAERDALKDWLFGCKKERDSLTVELGQARADVAKLRAALQKLLPWCDKVPESVFDHAKDVLAYTQDPPILDATLKT